MGKQHRKHSYGKTWLRAPQSLQHGVHFAEQTLPKWGKASGICWDSCCVELPCPSSRQVTTMEGSEVASCCSLRKWQAKPLSACDSGCLGMGQQPSSGRSLYAQEQLECVNSRARASLFGLRCGLGVNRECTGSVGCAKTSRH